MRCPECGSDRLQVVDSRDSPDGVRRRRECANGHRFTTYERREVFHCPVCGGSESRIDAVEFTQNSVLRHRQCAECNAYYDTMEVLRREEFDVVKRDGRSEPFSRDKLFQSLRRAASKRDVSDPDLWAAVSGIERTLVDLGRAEVQSGEVAQLAMERLLPIDAITYVRYASGYLGVTDVDGLLDVIRDARDRREARIISETHEPLVPAEGEAAER